MLTPPAALEALLFADGGPVEKKQITNLLDIKESELEIAVKVLSKQLEGHGISVIETDDEIELRTSVEAAGVVKKLRESELSRDLGKASMETLATIAYKNGSTRGEIDWVRGVNSSASLRTLLMRGLIEGKEDERDRRRIRYNVTTEALAHLGINRIENLPRYAELSVNADSIAGEKAE
jgi:segregation and condensation protein B